MAARLPHLGPLLLGMGLALAGLAGLVREVEASGATLAAARAVAGVRGSAALPDLGPDGTTTFGRRRLLAEADLARLDETAALPGPARAERAREVAAGVEARLARAPADGLAWLALARARELEGGPAAPALAALRLSYASAPREQAVMMPRVALSLRAWPALPEDLRREVRAEMAALADPARDKAVLRHLALAAVRAGPDRVVAAHAEARRVAPLAGELLQGYVAEALRGAARGAPR